MNPANTGHEDGWDPEPTDEWMDEIERRLAAHAANPENVRTWEQVLERLQRAGP